MFVGSLLLGIFSAMGFGLFAAVAIGVAIPLIIGVAARRLNHRQHGTKEHLTPSQRKWINLVLILNVAIFGLYLALYFVIVPILSNAAISLVIVIAILAVWLLANRLLFRNLQKQAITSMEEKV